MFRMESFVKFTFGNWKFVNASSRKNIPSLRESSCAMLVLSVDTLSLTLRLVHVIRQRTERTRIFAHG